MVCSASADGRGARHTDQGPCGLPLRLRFLEQRTNANKDDSEAKSKSEAED